MRKNLSSMAALLAGTALVALLLAPASGAQLRRVLRYRIKSSVRPLQRLITLLLHTHATLSKEAQAAGQEVIEETMQRAKLLLQAANELAAQLDD